MRVHVVTAQDPDGFEVLGVYTDFNLASRVALRTSNKMKDQLHGKDPCTDRNGDCPVCEDFATGGYHVRVETRDVEHHG